MSTDKALNIIEIFGSVQGETSLSGVPTAFIRLAACNLRCTWCDTPYSFGRGSEKTIRSIIEQVKDFGLTHVCVTGGEPLLQQNVHVLMHELLNQGFQISLETGGSLPVDTVDHRIKIILDLKCPGSGMSEKNLWKNLERIKTIDEVKFVIADKQDYLFAKGVCLEKKLFQQGIEVLFSPVHAVLDPQTLVEWILKDRLPVRLNLQIHKYIWTPDTIGV